MKRLEDAVHGSTQTKQAFDVGIIEQRKRSRET
jgi:hypothetical protein